MRSSRIRLIAASFAAVLSVGIPASIACAQEPIIMMLAHVVNPGSPRDRLLHLFGEKLEERTDGRIEVQVYPSGQLGDNTQIIEGVQAGTIQGSISPTAFMGSFESILTVLDLPMMFSSLDEVSKIANSDVGADLFKLTEAKGLHGLAFYAEGEKHFATTFPIDSMEDLQGKQLRSIPAPVLLEQFHAWGVNPVPVEFLETYGAIQNGMVEGQEQQWGLVYDLKFFEVSPELTETGHGMLVEFFFVSKVWFDSLPEDLQAAIEEEATALIPTREEWTRTYTAEALEKLKAADGVHYRVASSSLLDELKEASESVYDSFRQEHGPQAAELIERIESQAAEMR